jgi:hypothetical protein
MAKHHDHSHGRLALACAIAMLIACDGDSQVGSSRSLSALTAVCVDGADLPVGAWACPEPRKLACSEIDDATLYLVEPEADACAGDALIVSQAGPFVPGTHVITIRDDDGDAECTTELTVVDDEAPVLAAQTIALWPPNHELRMISVAECVRATDDCDPDLQAEFIWASSDEPADDIGDGHHQPDIVLGDDCQHVSVRAERQGPKDGRVYRLGVRVTDHAGNSTDGECTVIVDHDPRGVAAADNGEAYRIAFDGSGGGLVCDGVSDPPPPGDEDAGSDDGADAGDESAAGDDADGVSGSNGRVSLADGGT